MQGSRSLWELRTTPRRPQRPRLLKPGRRGRLSPQRERHGSGTRGLPGWQGGISDPVDGGDISVSTFALQLPRPPAPAPNPRPPYPGTPLPWAAPPPPSVPPGKDARQLTRTLFKAPTSRPSAGSPGLLQTGRRRDKASLGRTPPSSGPLSARRPRAGSTPALAFKPTQHGAGPPAGRMRRTGLAEVAGERLESPVESSEVKGR